MTVVTASPSNATATTANTSPAVSLDEGAPALTRRSWSQQDVQSVFDGAHDANRLHHDPPRVRDHGDRQHDLHAAREPRAAPEVRQAEGTEDEEEEDQDPHRTVVPADRRGRFGDQHAAHSARAHGGTR